jgi:membrane protein required for colicin V production
VALFTGMIWIDYAIIGLVGIYLLVGLTRGGKKEMLSLLSWLLALGVAWCYTLEFSVFLKTAVVHSPARMAASFVIMLMITRVFAGLIFFLMTEGTRRDRITLLGHAAGMVVGLIRGLILVAVIVLLSGLTPLPNDSWWLESRLIPPFQSVAVWSRDHIPSGIGGYIHFS